MTDLVRMDVRLAIRREGRFINAYLAGTDSMADAELLGSILVAMVEAGEGYFERWKELMTAMFAAHVENVLGVEPEMIEERAPEHERSGHG